MVIKVKHDELNQVSDIIKKDSEEFDLEIDNMFNQISRLREVWQGMDADEFCDNMDIYLLKMKNITFAMNDMNTIINTANKGYEEYDIAFGNALNKEADNYEE